MAADDSDDEPWLTPREWLIAIGVGLAFLILWPTLTLAVFLLA